VREGGREEGGEGEEDLPSREKHQVGDVVVGIGHDDAVRREGGREGGREKGTDRVRDSSSEVTPIPSSFPLSLPPALPWRDQTHAQIHRYEKGEEVENTQQAGA